MHRVWGKGVNPNIARTQFKGKCATDVFYGSLHGAINTEAWSSAVCLNRRDIDDRAALQHFWNARANKISDTCEVFINDRTLALIVYVKNPRIECSASIIDEHINTGQISDPCIDRIGIAYVENSRDTRCTEITNTSSNTFHVVFITITNKNGCTKVCIRHCNGLAKTFSGTRDDDIFAV